MSAHGLRQAIPERAESRIDTSDNLRQFDVDQVEVTRRGAGVSTSRHKPRFEDEDIGTRKYSTVVVLLYGGTLRM
jgi:hypothetical protein